MSALFASESGRRHDLNNLLCKILGASELALDQPCSDAVRHELETIIALAEEGARIVASISQAEATG